MWRLVINRSRLFVSSNKKESGEIRNNGVKKQSMAAFASVRPTGAALWVAETQCRGCFGFAVNNPVYGGECSRGYGDNVK